MKKVLFTLLVTSLFPIILSAQDTIFVRNGNPIVANIVEKSKTEIKYKKADQPQSLAIYSVFTSDIIKICYSDGTVADYSQIGKVEEKAIKPIDLAGTVRAFKFNLGFGPDYFMMKPGEDLLYFWRLVTGDNGETIETNPLSYGVNFNFGFQYERHLAGGKLDLILTQPDAFSASVNSGNSSMNFKSFYYNISAFYGHTLNHKKNLALMFETGLDIPISGGIITINNTEYKNEFLVDMGYHLATGIDWLATRRLMASCRIGYRAAEMEEMHRNESSPSGYSSFTMPPDGRKLAIPWKGVYFGAGLNWSFYTILKK